MRAMDCDPSMGSFLSDWTGIDIDFSDAGDILLDQGGQGLQDEISRRLVTDPTIQASAQASLEKGAAQQVADFIIKNKTYIGIGLAAVVLLSLAVTFKK